jgi:predicted transcriptional regulator
MVALVLPAVIPYGMPVVKRAVSFDPDVWADLQRIAAQERIGVSTVVDRALRHELRLHHGLTAVASWEAEHGAFTAQELADADGILDEAGVGAGQAPLEVGR